MRGAIPRVAWWAVAALVLVAATLPVDAAGQAQQVKPVALPDTGPGRVAAAYLAAFNAGSDDAMREFFTSHMAASAASRRPLAERLSMTAQMRGELGTLTPVAVIEEAPDHLTALLRSAKGEWLRATFMCEAQAPHGLLGIRIEPGDPEDVNGPPPAMSLDEALAAVRREIGERVAKDTFAGTVLIARDGHPVLLEAWGLADRRNGVPNRVDTRYNLGSINKLFTKAAIGQLIQAGKLSFDTKLGEVLPDYPNAEAREAVTVRQLLDMRSGIGDFFGPRFDATPKDRLRANADFLPLFADQPLAFPPGTQQQYSNGGYIVLGAIVEKLTGMPYVEAVRERVFKPAGMNDSDWFQSDAIVPNLAMGYTRGAGGSDDSSGPLRENIFTRPACGSAAGGGYATAEDLLRFVDALLGDKLLSTAYTDWYLTGFEPGSPGAAPSRRQGGLGFAGGAPGINAALEVDLGTGTTIVVMTNLDPPAAMDASRAIRRLMAAVAR